MKKGFLRILAAALLAAVAGTAFAAPKQLLGPPRGPVSDRVPDFVRSGAQAVRFNADEMLNLGPGEDVELSLPNGKRQAYVFELREAHGNGIYSWIGKHKERGSHNRAIVTTGPAGSFAVFSTPEGEFRLVPGNGGHDWLVDMTAEGPFIPPIELGDDGLQPPPQPKSTAQVAYVPGTMERIPGVNSLFVTKATPTPQAVIDLMVVYTSGFATNLGANLMTRLYFLVTRSNTAYADSEVAITLRLVQAVQVNYSDATSDSVALNAITPPSGAFDAATFGNIETLRAAAGADLVAFLRNGSSFGGSGLAWVGSTNPPGMSTYMYSLTTGCVLGCESVFIHELGHNMGNKHDRHTTSYQAGGTPTPPAGAFSYSFGYAYCASGLLSCDPTIPGGCASQPECSTPDVSNFADIMAYFHGTATRLYKFSNPSITCASPSGDGVPRPCGIIDTDPSSANTALSMNNNRMALAAIKGTVAGSNQPGSLQFTSTVASAPESAGSITFNVSRLGGTGGAVSASYSTQSGSALAGVDYVSSSGNVSWTDGDSANKSIVIPLIANGAGINGTTFKVNLSNPTGAAGVFLGNPTSATGIIQEPWPPSGLFPTGFLTPDGSSGSWTVATDRVYEGTTSLRSAQVFGSLTGPTYTNSDMSYTANFGAGPVSFAYNVSSWANPGYYSYGIFEFIVDGVAVLSDAGETGWKVFSYNLTAGTHTLRWRFRNAMPSACSGGWNPPAPGGVNCADRAWIDALVLPPPNVIGLKARKAHGGAGTFEITLDPLQSIGGPISVEPRSLGPGHVLAFQFDAAVTAAGTVVCVDETAAPVACTSAAVGSTVEVTIPALGDAKAVKATLANVNGIGMGAAGSSGFLVGDVNGSRSVTSADILATKGRQGTSIVTNYRYDVDRNAAIDAADVTAVKANAGLSIP